MKFVGHPAHHGRHINPYACGSGQHRGCSGFSGDYDTYLCGCCCHDNLDELTEKDREIVARLRGDAEALTARAPQPTDQETR